MFLVFILSESEFLLLKDLETEKETILRKTWLLADKMIEMGDADPLLEQ